MSLVFITPGGSVVVIPRNLLLRKKVFKFSRNPTGLVRTHRRNLVESYILDKNLKKTRDI